MGAILDIIGSYIFKAAMIGIIITTSINLNGVMVEKNQLAIAQKNLNVAISVIEWDMKNIGYGLATPTSSITEAHLYRISFTADVNNDGVASEAVRLYYQYKGFTAGIGYRYDLIRSVNGVGFTLIQDMFYNPSPFEVWRFYYYDKEGKLLPFDYDGGYQISPTNVPRIRGIKVFIRTKSALVTNGQYTIAEREFSVYPANLSLN